MAAQTILEFGSGTNRLAVMAWRIIAMRPAAYMNPDGGDYTSILVDESGAEYNSFTVNESHDVCAARWRAAIDPGAE